MKKETLITHCNTLGIQLVTGRKYRNKDLIRLIGNKYIDNGYRKNTWALQERLKLDTCMLCANYKHLKEEQKQIVMADNNHWIAERKWNGCRMLIFYNPSDGFTFYSRNISDIDFLPIEYDNILFNASDNPANYINKYKMPFIIDAEVITTHNHLDTSILPRNFLKVQKNTYDYTQNINSELNAAVAMLQYNKEDSYLLQQQNPLIFKCFDLIMCNNEYLYNTPLYKRIAYLKELIKYLPSCFQVSEQVNENKIKFFEDIVSNKGEGIVLKNLYSPYNNAGTRHADKWIKMKRTMVESLGADNDMFVIGYNLGNKGTKNENLVGSLKMGVFLRDKNGLLTEHHLATCSNFTDEFRHAITSYDENGKAMLKEDLYGAVFVVNGHTVSARNLMFNHAILESFIPRLDKSKYDCVIDEDILRQNIL